MEIITGNKFKKICDYIMDENGFNKTQVVNKIPIYFVKTDFLSFFFNHHKPQSKYKLITHNSDFPIDQKYKDYLNDDNLIFWYGQNVNFVHDKLQSIPIGIANEIWPHGDEKVLNEVINKKNKKNKLIHCSFNVSTNYYERNQCINAMKKNNLSMDKYEDFKNYLNSLSKSFFTLSPNGNGIDCHKLWESLYLKTIPVVTKSINIDFYRELPIYIIDSWSDFDLKDLNEELYYKIIDKYDFEKIKMSNYVNKILN